jgi:deazaflavin-dependent oxidoreductase (nitroreductase family)
MTDPHNRNERIIKEFRDHGGRVGGPFEGAPLLLLHHIGRKTGTERVNPVMYQQVGTGWAIFASAAGADDHPAWYRNLLAHRETMIEVGTETYQVRARELDAHQREPIWQTQKQRFPGFQDYENRTSRTIPVVLPGTPRA